jgi:ACS family hexuronate transporter-like MFS transporter
MATANRSEPWLALRWRIAILLCLITTINYIDRQALSVAAPVLRGEFSISDIEYGWITAAFLGAYAIGQLITGPIIDRLGTKKAFSLAVIVWSIAAMMHALGRGFLSFLSLRVLLGIGEAANFPAASKAIAEWFPRSERSMAFGILTVGPGLGAVLSPPLIGVLIIYMGWKAAFIISGAIGFVWLLLWHRWYHEPEKHPDIHPRELKHIRAGREPEPDTTDTMALVDFLRIPQVWGLMLSRFVADGAFYFFVFWLPQYLVSERGFSIAEIAMFAWLPYLAADAGSLAGGWSGQVLMKRGMSLDRARKLTIWIGALLVPVAMPAVTVESATLALMLIAVAMFGIQYKTANFFAVPADLFPARDVATIWGIFGAVGSFGGAIFSYSAGWLIENFSYEPVFALVAALHIVSASQNRIAAAQFPDGLTWKRLERFWKASRDWSEL